jgi:DNA-directed RNA polymerase specialized sigma54-like protein
MSLAQVLAPQLQQSLALLQAPTLELKALVEQELQQNPVLEEVPVEDMEQKERTTDKDGETAPEAAPDPPSLQPIYPLIPPPKKTANLWTNSSANLKN